MGVLAGVATAVITTIAGVATFDAYVPFSRPTLQLLSDSVAAGEHLGFIQSSIPVKPCQQEQVRMMWRDIDLHGVKARQVFLLSDTNVVNKLWDGPTVIMVNIPKDAPPGHYNYTRQSQTWCSWVNYVFGPAISQTADVPFQVTSPVAP